MSGPASSQESWVVHGCHVSLLSFTWNSSSVCVCLAWCCHFLKERASYFVECPLTWIYLMFPNERQAVYFCLESRRSGTLARHVKSFMMVILCTFYLVRVVPARFLHYLVVIVPSLIDIILLLWGDTLKRWKYPVSHPILPPSVSIHWRPLLGWVITIMVAGW